MVHVHEVAAGFMALSGLISLALLVFAVAAYRRTREAALAFVAGAFVLFSIKSFFVGYSVWTGLIEHELLELMDAMGDLATITMFVLPILWPAR